MTHSTLVPSLAFGTFSVRTILNYEAGEPRKEDLGEHRDPSATVSFHPSGNITSESARVRFRTTGSIQELKEDV